MHGALQESYHVFIHQGLFRYSDRVLDVLEMGFGTGLNALITLLEAPARKLQVRYTTLEAFPLDASSWNALDYGDHFPDHPAAGSNFRSMHEAPWGSPVGITDGFTLHKIQTDLLSYSSLPAFDLVYFDAFGARVQPELWSERVFRCMYGALRPGGTLVTYAAKGSVRRTMEAVGFRTERLPGPPGKREMLRANKG